VDHYGTLFVTEYSGNLIRQVCISNSLFHYLRRLSQFVLASPLFASLLIYTNSSPQVTPAGVVTTYAGTGTGGWLDGPVGSAQFSQPYDITVDQSGTLYVADKGNNRIRRIAKGVVATIAGSGSPGYLDGTGTNAQFYYPSGITVDVSGNLYIADLFNRCVRQITPSGVVSTLAGTPAATNDHDGQGTLAGFFEPLGVTVDISGNVYVADYTANTIRLIQNGGYAMTLAGNRNAGWSDGYGSAALFKGPSAVAISNAQTLVVADQNNNRIRKIQVDNVCLSGMSYLRALSYVAPQSDFSAVQAMYVPWLSAAAANMAAQVSIPGGDQQFHGTPPCLQYQVHVFLYFSQMSPSSFTFNLVPNSLQVMFMTGSTTQLTAQISMQIVFPMVTATAQGCQSGNDNCMICAGGITNCPYSGSVSGVFSITFITDLSMDINTNQFLSTPRNPTVRLQVVLSACELLSL
jgi:hypothetical protein